MIDLNKKILVVTHFPLMRRIMCNMLKDLGLTNVQDAEDGVDGLSKLRAESFDIVLTAWDMPNMTGIDLLRAIRADPKLKQLPVTMVTGCAKRENIIEASEAGASGYYIQPMTAGSFGEYLNKIIQSMNGLKNDEENKM